MVKCKWVFGFREWKIGIFQFQQGIDKETENLSIESITGLTV